MRKTLLRAASTATAAASSAALCCRFSVASCSAETQQSPTPERMPDPTSAPVMQTMIQSAPVQTVLTPFNNAYDYVWTEFIKPWTVPSREKLLPDIPPQFVPKPTLVVSLDGCLIESLWTRQHGWRYIKRPGVDEFLEHLSPFFEIVLWTDAMNTADPVVDRFDTRRRIRHRLYRDTTTFVNGAHRKDLKALNRNLARVLIVDTQESAFALQPRNGLLVPKYDHKADPQKKDNELTKLIPFLKYLAFANVSDFRDELDEYRPDVAATFEKKLPELRAAGKLRAPRVRTVVGGGQGSSGPTLWERLRQRS
mmetsp:Transcript_17148/g.28733  ORF Transcript_17148/g.28733 Transcript_17148/m.28733 type:complete len:309 (+) Transcript_17148:24-950(+)